MKLASIFSIGIQLMNRLTYARKFTFIITLFLIPFLIVLSLLILDINERITFAEKERKGIEYISEVRNFVQRVQQHRGLSVTYLQGGTHVKEDLAARQEMINGIIEKIDQINDRLGKNLLVEHRWDDLKNEWYEIELNVFSYNSEETIERHGAFIRNVANFQMYLATTSNLILDSDKANYFLVGAVLDDLPNMAEYMGMSRAIGTAVVNNKKLLEQENIDLLFNLKSMESYFNASNRKFQFAYMASAEVEREIEDEYKQAQQAAVTTFNLIDKQILTAPTINLTTDTFFSTITGSIDSVYALMEKGTEILDSRLTNHISVLKAMLLTVSAISIFVTAFLLYLFVSFYLGVRDTVIHLKEKMEQFANGDLTTKTNLVTKDETREIGIAFNQMSDNFRAIIFNNKEISEQIAASSEQLTASIEQTTDAIKQVAGIIEKVADGAETQVSGANESALASEEMALGIQQIAERSSTVSDFSTKTQEKAIAGGVTVNESKQQFNSIKEFVMNISQTIHELSNHSKEIGNITSLINGVAEQTNLLALNAAIEAARAGEHGKGFSVVADEVRKLAEETKTSTNKIASIIQQVQELTSHAVKTMDEGTTQVDAGTEVMKTLGVDFEEILTSINKVSDQIHEVSAVAQQLSANSEEVAATVNELSIIASDNSTNSQSVVASTQEQLATMEEINSAATELSLVAQKLNDMINKFKL